MCHALCIFTTVVTACIHRLAVLPVGSFYHTVCFDSLTDAFQGGACNMASSLAACLRSVGFEMPRVHGVVPLLDVDRVVEGLTVRL